MRLCGGPGMRDTGVFNVSGEIQFREFNLPVSMSKALDSRSIKITWTRPWKTRLFSWPWRPWIKTVEHTLYTSTPPEIVCDGEMMHVKFLIDRPEVPRD